MQIGHEVTVELFTCPKKTMIGTVVAHGDDGVVVLVSCLHLTIHYPSGQQVLASVSKEGLARGERPLKGPICRVLDWKDGTGPIADDHCHCDDDVISISYYEPVITNRKNI